MYRFTAFPDMDEQPLKKVILTAFPAARISALKKAFKNRDIKMNGQSAREDQRVRKGDEITLYLADDRLFGALDPLYEDEHVLVVHKPAGVSVEADQRGSQDTLHQRALRHVGQGFLMPCHRLDHHTKGIVCFAKTKQAHEEIIYAFQKGWVTKQYACLVRGCPRVKEQTLSHFGVKDREKSLMRIASKGEKGAVDMVTKYKVVKTCGELSLLDVQIFTGRTHQIRAQLSHIGHPILGDDKYGDYAFNKKWGAKYQALIAYRLILKPEGALAYLGKKTFEIPIDFALPKAAQALAL